MNDYICDPSAIIDEGCHIGRGTHIWHFCHLIAGCHVGERCNIGQNVVIMRSAQVGNGVKIQNNVSVYDGVVLEDDVFVGPSAVFTNVTNPRAFIDRKHEYKQTLIRRGATIGANATIVCGRTVGQYALIGAGCVVTHDVPDFALIMGNPAKQHGWVSRNGHRLTFDDEGLARCPETGELYRLKEDEKVELVEQ